MSLSLSLSLSLSRRKALTILGGGTILAAGAAAGGFLATRRPAAALAPWQAAGGYADPRKRALSYALLAPNPHNLQPWQVALTGADEVLILRDPDKALPETDPFDRQIVIGFGCFLEQMAVAASLDGLRTDITPFPDGEGGPVAHVRFRPGAAPDPLAGAMLARRSCKEPFEDSPVPAARAEELARYARIVTAPDEVAALKALTWEAWMIEMQTPRTLMESVELMRFGKAEINADPDGIDLGGPFLESLMLIGMLSRENQADPASAGFREGIRIYREMLAATPAYAVIATKANTRAAQIAAGRAWLRLNLATTAAGLALQPVSQCLQEYPEMAGPKGEVHRLLAGPGETVQMLGRLGYGPAVPPSPRWPLEAKLTDA